MRRFLLQLFCDSLCAHLFFLFKIRFVFLYAYLQKLLLFLYLLLFFRDHLL